MELRTPDIEAYEDILDFWETCGITYRPDGRDARDSIATELEANPEYWIAAYDGDAIVGIIVGTDDGRKGWINRLAVHPSYRREAIASRLVERLEAEFEEKGLHVFAALVEGDNGDSKEFFENVGYEGSEIEYYSKRENELV